MPAYNWPPMAQRKVIGTRMDRVDALAKITGKAKYSYDVQLPDMLHAAMLTSPHAHARVRLYQFVRPAADRRQRKSKRHLAGLAADLELRRLECPHVPRPDAEGVGERARRLHDVTHDKAGVMERGGSWERHVGLRRRSLARERY